MMDKVPKKILSVRFSNILFSLLFTLDDLVMQALAWLPMVWYRAIRFGAVWFGALFVKLRQPHIFNYQT